MDSPKSPDGVKEAVASTQHVPLVHYGKNIDHIPGDRYGKKFHHSGNVSHLEDRNRALQFKRFSQKDLSLQDEKKTDDMTDFLTGIKASFIDDKMDKYTNVVNLRDDATEKTIEFEYNSMKARISQFKDVFVHQRESYYNTQRALDTEIKSTAKMNLIEDMMGRNVENYLMAKRISSGNVPPMGQYRPSKTRPEGGEKKKEWYKELRQCVIRAFWMDNSQADRDRLRSIAREPEVDLQPTIAKIESEDRSISQDFFYQHLRDSAAASDPTIYRRIEKDVLVILDGNGDLILCSVSQLFQHLFGSALVDKVNTAAKQWTGLVPLPRPSTARHAVDEFILRSHPELNMELAITPQELEERPMCVVHYGTWAMKGHPNPKDIYLTPDTLLQRGASEKVKPNQAPRVFSHFKFGVLGISSEVARFLMRHLAPKEYEACIETFNGLPRSDRMAVSRPNWATLIVFGVNSFTQRHCDKHDIKHGFASLIPLGNYSGGDLCFPQLGLKLDYKPGSCLIFRGTELEHFVEDWQGYRLFVLCTNHQAVRNYAHRRMGKLDPLPSDPWYRPAAGVSASGNEDVLAAHDSSSEDDDDEGALDPCILEDMDIEKEPMGGWTDADIHGAGTWDPRKNVVGYVSSSTSSSHSQESGSDSIACSEPKRQRLA
ncbi:hypothetical protein F5B20DRAFT_592706 [Whalleya microplaca]|nr:hypothetical protein F5B20DRAFT_592706 [Whalleya microplaca]